MGGGELRSLQPGRVLPRQTHPHINALYCARASVHFSPQALRHFAFQQHVTVAPPVQAPVLPDLHVCFAGVGIAFLRFRYYGGHFHDPRVGRLRVGQLLQLLVGPRWRWLLRRKQGVVEGSVGVAGRLRGGVRAFVVVGHREQQVVQ